KATLGPDDPLTLTARVHLARPYQSLGRNAEAARMVEEVLRVSEARFPSDNRLNILARSCLGISYRDLGRSADSARLLKAALKELEPHYGPRHVDTLITRIQLAGTGGEGDDRVPIRCNAFGGPATVEFDLGAGADEFPLEENTFAGPV